MFACTIPDLSGMSLELSKCVPKRYMPMWQELVTGDSRMEKKKTVKELNETESEKKWIPVKKWGTKWGWWWVGGGGWKWAEADCNDGQHERAKSWKGMTRETLEDFLYSLCSSKSPSRTYNGYDWSVESIIACNLSSLSGDYRSITLWNS